MLRLEFLETHHIWFGLLEPSQEVLQPLIDVVDIEGSDSHTQPRPIMAFANAKR